MNDYTLSKFIGQSVDAMCKVNQKYAEYAKFESDRKVLYVQLWKALYGCFVTALIWYEKFSAYFKEMGFRINFYESCNSNKIIDRKQRTIAWYVDDIKDLTCQPRCSHPNHTIYSDEIWKNLSNMRA